MKRPNLEMLLYTLIALGLCVLLGSTLTTCQADPIPTSEQRLPVQDNFSNEKIWTESDFQQAEIPSENINYYQICDELTGDCPPAITAEDIYLINQHHQKQMKKLTAGVTQ